MEKAHSKAIEILRENIESLTIPISNFSLNDKNQSPKDKINNKYKEIKDEKRNIINNEIEKDFNEIYNLYANDKEYKKKQEEKERNKLLKITHFESHQILGDKYYREKKVLKPSYDFEESLELLERNNHERRKETRYEDDFSSSDSYESDLFEINTKVPKNFKLKTKKDYDKAQNNIKEIVKVLKLNI